MKQISGSLDLDIVAMLGEHRSALEYLFHLMLRWFWLFPIASAAIYGLFAWRRMGRDSAALLFSICIPGSAFLPVTLSLNAVHCCDGVMKVFSLLFPAMWILPLVAVWQGSILLRNNRGQIGRASIIAAIGLTALYPFTSFIGWRFNSIQSL